MATITGYTSTRMKQIEDESVVGGVVEVGNLILTRRDGTPINAGSVIGPVGPVGPPAEFGGYKEPLDDRGNVSGNVSLNLNTHNVWRINPTGAVNLSFLNLPATTHVASGTLIVANSNHAITWPGTAKFPYDIPPVLDGETVLSVLARSSGITVGAAWVRVA